MADLEGQGQQQSFLLAFSRLVFLGDSNSDNGNVFQMTGHTHPRPEAVYWQGRYSNGKMWADHLEDMCSRPALNLAYGCATIDNTIVAGTVPMPGSRPRSEVPSVVDQIEQLRSLVGRLEPTELVFIQVGSNDLNALIDSGPTYNIKRSFTPAQLVARLVTAVRQLCEQVGARNVVVMNVRPREDYPGVVALGDPQKTDRTRQDTAQFNTALANELSALQDALGSDYRILVFDTYGFQKHTIPRLAGKFGIDLGLRPPYAADAVPESALFVDGAHLARRAHSALALCVVRALLDSLL
ncbi:hypothetical protein GGF46_000036 [Coemansia sp. RSA 552]|nr:hypothetical protein GGF46_000036 [Coemansia sp. RSA 552]